MALAPGQPSERTDEAHTAALRRPPHTRHSARAAHLVGGSDPHSDRLSFADTHPWHRRQRRQMTPLEGHGRQRRRPPRPVSRRRASRRRGHRRGRVGCRVRVARVTAGLNVVCLEQGGWPDRSAFSLHRTRLGPVGPWTVVQLASAAPRDARDYPIDLSESDLPVGNFNAVGGGTVVFAGQWPRRTPQAPERNPSSSLFNESTIRSRTRPTLRIRRTLRGTSRSSAEHRLGGRIRSQPCQGEGRGFESRRPLQCDVDIGKSPNLHQGSGFLRFLWVRRVVGLRGE